MCTMIRSKKEWRELYAPCDVLIGFILVVVVLLLIVRLQAI